MTTYRTVEQLEECGPYAWPGGYPIVFLDQDNESLCRECAKNDLHDAAELGWDDVTITAYVDEGQESDVFCAQCSRQIVESHAA